MKRASKTAAAEVKAPPTLEALLKSIKKASEELAATSEQIDDLRATPAEQRPANGDLSLDALQARLQRAGKDLDDFRRQGQAAAAEFGAQIHDLAANEKNQMRFYCSGESFLPLDADNRDLAAISSRLSEVTHASIANPDAVREINRLLKHAKAQRISEEMDMETYHERAAKLFGRIKQESAETVKIYHDLLDDAAAPKSSASATLSGLAARCREIGELAENLPEGEAIRKPLLDLAAFAARLRTFMSNSESRLDVFGKKFSSDAAIDDFKDSTRDICSRIEKTGLFASGWTLLAGFAGGLTAACILMFLDTNLALKNWFLEITVGCALGMYGFSVLFGRQARTAFMEAIRRRLLSDARGYFEGAASADEAFAFPKTDFAGSSAGNRLHSHGVEAAANGLRQDPRASRLNPLRQLSNSPASRHNREYWMFAMNGLVLAGIAGTLLAVSWLGGTLTPDAKFSFVSHDAAGNPCVMQNGRVLFANGGSYFVASAGSSEHAVPVTELRKPAIDLVSPAKSTKEMQKCLDALAAPDQPPAEVANAAAQPLVMPVVIDNAAQPGNVDFVTNIVTEERLVSLPLIVLPLFPDPVSGLEKNIYRADSDAGLTSKEEAYHFGQAHLVDPVSVSVKGNQESLIGRIASAMQACMQATATAYGGTPVPENAKLKLSVFGFASDTGFSKEQNHTLAEGRRLAVIRKLREKLTTPLAEIDKEPRKLEALSGVPSDLGQYAADFQFGDYSGMEKELNRLMLLASGSTKPDDQALIRSVVIRIESDALQYCGKERSEQAARLP